MVATDSPRNGSDRRRHDREGSEVGFRRLLNFLLLAGGAIVLLALSSNSLAISRNVGIAGDVPDADLMATVANQMQSYEHQMRSRVTKIEKDLERVANETQITSLQSRTERMEEALVSSEKQVSFLQSRLEKMEKDLEHEHEHVSDAKEQPTQLRRSAEAVSPQGSPTATDDFTSDFARLHQADDEESFSACLLIMDDNHRLSEWIAYHYFAMPLRHLVVTIDPRSRTSPSKILDRWRPLMNITLWGDEDFKFAPNALQNLNETNGQAKTLLHRSRQEYFYKHCATHLKKQKRTWTSFHDIDEFLTVDQHHVNNTDTLLKQPGSILQTLLNVRSTQPNNTHFQKNCITVPRVSYGSIESSIDEVQKDVPSFLDGMKFDTLRYRHRGKHGSGGPVKSILDVTYAIGSKKYRVHQLIGPEHCSSKWTTENVLGIHHYMGSWASYSFRDDARRGKEHSFKRWEAKANIATIKNDDEIRPWIQGFVDYVGEPLAKHLLQDVGEFEENSVNA
jgi:hypothetical protein